MAEEERADAIAAEAVAEEEIARQGAEYARASDLSWVATALAARREAILERWLTTTAALPFHHGQREHAIADHIPELFDALVDLLERAAPRWIEPGVPLDDDAVRDAAEAHAKMRVVQGLEPANVSIEFRLLRQELWYALREALPEDTSLRDTIGAQILLNDALDGAMALGLAALTTQIAQVREEFLATVVHEVRRPLTVIRGNAALSRRILGRPTPNLEQVTTLLNRIEEATGQMNTLLTTLVEISQAALGGFDLNLTSGDMVAIIEGAIAQSGADAARVQLSIAPQLDTTGRWDVERVEQIVSNIIANALKYSPAHTSVEVTIEGDATTLTCHVADQGIGIPPEELPRLFARYHRASNALAERIDGLGLGLYLCRALAELHGGRIWASSPGIGKGTTLHLTLPRVTAQTR
ncbi:MAG TPA: sensor histidine kinase [Thermomicrobiales bacterium]|jgi:signal transduction histidine kinase